MKAILCAIVLMASFSIASGQEWDFEEELELGVYIPDMPEMEESIAALQFEEEMEFEFEMEVGEIKCHPKEGVIKQSWRDACIDKSEEQCKNMPRCRWKDLDKKKKKKNKKVEEEMELAFISADEPVEFIEQDVGGYYKRPARNYCTGAEKITNPAECQRAASSMGIGWGGAGTWRYAHDIPGCMLANDGRYLVYYNFITHPMSNPHMKYEPICKRACTVSNTDVTGQNCDCAGNTCTDVQFCYDNTCNDEAKPKPIYYFKLEEGKECITHDKVGGEYMLNTPKQCRDECIEHHFETYFALVKKGADTVCYCYKDCDANERTDDPNSVIYEIVSDNISSYFLTKDEELISTKGQIDSLTGEKSNLDSQLTTTQNTLSTCQDDLSTTETELTQKQTSLNSCQNDLSSKTNQLTECNGKKSMWKSRYEYVDNNFNAKKDELFDKAEDTYKSPENAVGVVNCDPQQMNHDDSWFKFVSRITMGAILGAMVQAYASRFAGKMGEESEALL